MAKVSVYLPDALEQAARAHDVNVSTVLQQALGAVLEHAPTCNHRVLQCTLCHARVARPGGDLEVV